MTGAEFTEEYQQLIGQDYTGYAGGAIILNRRYLKSMVNVVKNIYRNSDDEREREYLRPFTIISNPYNAVLGANQVSLATPFNHLLYAAGTYSNLLRGLVVESFDLTTTPITVTLDRDSNIRSTEFIQFSVTNSAIVPDATFQGYVKQITKRKYALYSDVFLNVPLATADFPLVTATSTVYYVWRKYIKREMRSLNLDTKGNVLNRPTAWRPRFQMDGQVFTSGRLILFPDNVNLPDKNFIYWYNVHIDELKNPTAPIVSDDITVTLEDIYAREFLYLVMEEAAREYAKEKRDQELFTTSTNETLTQ